VADPQGFLRHPRRLPPRRPVPVRITDWREVYPAADPDLVREQATRCMDCGIPFCTSDTSGCPLANRIPDWNDLVRTGAWRPAIEALHATNNFPEFTGRLCPAPCEAACVLGIGEQEPVAIKLVEVEIINRAFDAGLVTPQPAPEPSGRSVAVVGSGPAGLAAAQQLARAGHGVTVYERDDALGGLLRYGIPDFKLEKHHIDRRLEQLRTEGVTFCTGVNVGVDVSAADLRAAHDAVLLATGALAGRDMPDTPGRHLAGVHLAMEHLVPANRVVAGRAAGPAPSVDASGRHVVIIGGGDTAADCLGVSHRQGAASVRQLDLYPLPPTDRDEARDPWPTWPWILRSYPAHEEGGERVFAVAVAEFVGSERVEAVRVVEVDVDKRDGRRIVTPRPGTEQELPADLVLLAIGFDGTEPGPLLDQFGLVRGPRGTLECGPDWQTPAEGVFVAGDAHRGASLIVWAIAEGRAAAAAIHSYLGGAGSLPSPVTPASHPLAAAPATSG
jgi:glutamate synthase (NADPH) small chain